MPILAAFRAAGGIAGLVKGRPGALARVEGAEPAPLVLVGADRAVLAAELRLTTLDLEDGPASLLTIRRLPEQDPAHRASALEVERAQLVARLSEQAAILDTATDGVVVLDDEGRILSLNRSAQALFGYEENEIAGEGFSTLFRDREPFRRPRASRRGAPRQRRGAARRRARGSGPRAPGRRDPAVH